MKVVIDIPKYVYDTIVANKGYIVDCDNEKVGMAVKNGTLIPKEHGRIVDIGSYEGKVIVSRIYCGINKPVEVAELDTIIEAESEE